MAKIMVVDDDPKIRQLVARFLEKDGHAVTQVTDGEYAMEAIRNDRPDLIVLDVLMPGLDGCSLGYHLKYQSKYKSIPLVLLTSLADRPYLARDIAAECFLTKPFVGSQLVQKINEILDSGKVTIGFEPPHSGTSMKRAKRKSALITSILCTCTATVALIVYTMHSNAKENPVVVNTMSPDRSLSMMADQVFLYGVPVAVVGMIYIAYVLREIMKDNKAQSK